MTERPPLEPVLPELSSHTLCTLSPFQLMKKDGELGVSFAHSKLSVPDRDQTYDLILIANAPANWASKPLYISDLITSPESPGH